MLQYEMHQRKNLQKVGTLYLQNIGVILTWQSREGRSIQGCQRTEGGDWICSAEVPRLGGRILKQTFPLLTSRRGAYTTNTHQQTLNLQLFRSSVKDSRNLHAGISNFLILILISQRKALYLTTRETWVFNTVFKHACANWTNTS